MIYHYLLSLKKYRISTACFRNRIADDSIILDVHSAEQIRECLRQTNPDYIINCIGILVNGARESTENAIYVNAYFPHLLVRLVNENNPSSCIIHISTDCVFSGVRGLYTDVDEKDALDVYGMTKNLGEIIDNNNLTIRTSIIGPELKENGEGLFHWVFSQREIKIINGYAMSIWGGVTTLELAKAMAQCIECDIKGLYQLSNGERISKYSLVKLIVEHFDLDIYVESVEGKISDKSILPSQRDGFSYIVPSYDIMIKELGQYMRVHNGMYSFYLE